MKQAIEEKRKFILCKKEKTMVEETVFGRTRDFVNPVNGSFTFAFEDHPLFESFEISYFGKETDNVRMQYVLKVKDNQWRRDAVQGLTALMLRSMVNQDPYVSISYVEGNLKLVLKSFKNIFLYASFGNEIPKFGVLNTEEEQRAILYVERIADFLFLIHEFRARDTSLKKYLTLGKTRYLQNIATNIENQQTTLSKEFDVFLVHLLPIYGENSEIANYFTGRLLFEEYLQAEQEVFNWFLGQAENSNLGQALRNRAGFWHDNVGVHTLVNPGNNITEAMDIDGQEIDLTNDQQIPEQAKRAEAFFLDNDADLDEMVACTKKITRYLEELKKKGFKLSKEANKAHGQILQAGARAQDLLEQRRRLETQYQKKLEEAENKYQDTLRQQEAMCQQEILQGENKITALQAENESLLQKVQGLDAMNLDELPQGLSNLNIGDLRKERDDLRKENEKLKQRAQELDTMKLDELPERMSNLNISGLEEKIKDLEQKNANLINQATDKFNELKSKNQQLQEQFDTLKRDEERLLKAAQDKIEERDNDKRKLYDRLKDQENINQVAKKDHDAEIKKLTEEYERKIARITKESANLTTYINQKNRGLAKTSNKRSPPKERETAGERYPKNPTTDDPRNQMNTDETNQGAISGRIVPSIQSLIISGDMDSQEDPLLAKAIPILTSVAKEGGTRWVILEDTLPGQQMKYKVLNSGAKTTMFLLHTGNKLKVVAPNNMLPCTLEWLENEHLLKKDQKYKQQHT